MATTYQFRVDSFRILKTGAPGGILTQDPFNDGVPPPDASETPPPPPPLVPSYSITGGLAEADGRLIFDSNNSPLLATLGSFGHSAYVQQAIFNTNTDPDETSLGLKPHHEFATEAVFDLIIPQENNQEYGVRFTDSLGNSGPTANGIAALVVVRGTDGRVWVELNQRELVSGAITVLGRVELEPGGADQIKLRLDHAADSNFVTGSFELLTSGVSAGVVNVGGQAQIFNVGPNDVNVTRASVYTTNFINDEDRANYVYELDSLRIEKNGNNILVDQFNDGVVQRASNPQYNIFGHMSEAIESDGDGVLVMDSHFSQQVNVGGETARLMQLLTLTDIQNEQNGMGLKSNDDFALFARFNLLLPQEERSEYGIRFTDSTGAGTGDDVVAISVRKGTDGIVRVILSDRNLTNSTQEFLGSIELTPELIGTADQIGLALHHDKENPGVITASFRLFENGAEVPGGPYILPGFARIFGSDTLTTADDEVWTRAQVFSTAFDSDQRIWVEGMEGNDNFVGTNADEYFMANPGDDVISAGGGTDTVYGGRGNDTVVLTGNRTDYTITTDVNGVVTLVDNRGGSPDGTTHAISVENFQFASGTVAASLLSVPEIELRGLGNNEIADNDLTPSAVDGTAFGSVNFGATATQTFTIKNIGGEPLTIGNFKVPAGFKIVTPPPPSVAGGSSATFVVAVDTSKIGDKSGQITFSTNDGTGGENAYNFAVSAKVVAAPAPEVTLTGTGTKAGQIIKDNDTTPSAVDGTDFGSAELGLAGTERTFTIKNDGTADLVISNLELPTGFILVDGLDDGTIEAGSSDTFTVKLDTSVFGQKSGHITFTTNDPDEQDYNFAIKGNVTATPEIEVRGNGTQIVLGDITPDAADDTNFGSAVLGSAGVVHSFVVHNTGNAPLTVQNIKVPAGFKLVQNITSPIAAGDSATFAVELTTAKPGTFTGDIQFVTNDLDEKNFKFRVTGSVTQPEIDVTGNGISIKDGSKKALITNHTLFGTGIGLDDTPPVRTFTITNAPGAADLTITSATLVGSGFTLLTNLDGTVLQGGESVTFDVAIDTTVAGTRSATLQIVNNDANEALYDFVITGTVGPRNIVGDDALNDVFNATADPERFVGLDGDDTVSYANASGAVVASLVPASAKKNSGFAAGDLFESIENLKGSAFGDTLTGNDADNILEGGLGADKLDGGKGIDYASYENAAGPVTADLLKAANNSGEAAGDTYKKIEGLVGSTHNDRLVGDTKANFLMGGDGDDTLVGNGGIDVLEGGLGADTFVFNATKDGGGATKVLGTTPAPTGDLITDFVSGVDTIGILRSGFKLVGLDNTTFEAEYFVSEVGTGPTLANQTGVTATKTHGQFLFNQTTDQLWWDPDGTGKQAAVLLATFTNGAHLTATDFDLLA